MNDAGAAFYCSTFDSREKQRAHNVDHTFVSRCISVALSLASMHEEYAVAAREEANCRISPNDLLC
jgi:hypothetical protein